VVGDEIEQWGARRKNLPQCVSRQLRSVRIPAAQFGLLLEGEPTSIDGDQGQGRLRHLGRRASTRCGRRSFYTRRLTTAPLTISAVSPFKRTNGECFRPDRETAYVALVRGA